MLHVDETAYNQAVQALKTDRETIARSNERKESRATEISVNRNIPIRQAREIVHAQTRRDLHPDDVIRFRNFGDVCVKDVLSNPKMYDGEPCCDPSEPEMGTGKAIFFSNAHSQFPKPVVHSMLHGGISYFLHSEGNGPEQDLQWNLDDLELYLSRIDASECLPSDKSALINDIAKYTDKSDRVSLDVIRKGIKRHLGVNIGAFDATVKANQEAEEKEEKDDRTHAELTIAFIKDYLSGDPGAVGCEGSIWEYNKRTGLYEEKLLSKIEVTIGNNFSGSYCKRASDYRSISRLVYNQILGKNFFEARQYGVACEDSYICIKENTLVEQDYSHHLRQRHKLHINPKQGDCPLFESYLNDSFAGDEQIEQVKLLQEILGGLVTGCFYKIQKAVLLHGGGDNGKSVLLELLYSFFPPHLKSAISPSNFGKEYDRAQLAGKLVNIVGELEQTKALPSASFKDIIGCDTSLTARLPYKEPFSFKPIAGHIFSSNHFPQTKDHTVGFYRRWVVLDYHNQVEEKKKIPNLGALIAEKESPQVLEWALVGARRLIQNGFKLSLTKKHAEMMDLWQVHKDSVYSFIFDDDEVERRPNAMTAKTEFYKAYRFFCSESGLRPVGRNHFYERCLTKLSESKSKGVRVFLGVHITPGHLGHF